MSRQQPDGPDFLCIGAQKGGTSWLYDQVATHPDFWMPPVKELHYFDQEGRSNWADRLEKRFGDGTEPLRGRVPRERAELRPQNREADRQFVRAYLSAMRSEREVARYATLFAGAGDKITGDVTPAFSILEEDWIEKISVAFPELKIVFIAREPVDRLWSHYRMFLRVREREEPGTIQEVLDFAQSDLAKTRSYPSRIVTRWRRHFDEERFLVQFFDDLRVDAARVRNEVLTFLGADPDLTGRYPEDFNRKKIDKKLPLTDEFRAALVEHFAEEIRRSADELGGAAARWPEKYGLSAGPHDPVVDDPTPR